MTKRSIPRRAASLRNSRRGDEVPAAEAPQRLRFAAELPGGRHGPLWKLHVEALTEPAPGGGERLKLRAHVQTNLASAARPALAALTERLARQRVPSLAAPLAAPLAATAGALLPRAQQAAQGVSAWVERRARALAPRLSAWAEPLLQHDVQTWMEVHLSTAPLERGAQALLPNVAGLARLGITPQTGPDSPPLQSWQGRMGDESAQVSLLRLDDGQLPASLRQSLGVRSLQLAAAVVNVARRNP